MVNSKAIGGIITGVTLIVIIIVFVSNSNQDTTPDTVQTNQQENAINISDSAAVIKTPTNNTNYIIDENGNRQYIISAVDTPELKDWAHLGSYTITLFPLWN